MYDAYTRGLAGSNPVLTTLIKLVYEQPLRWDALIITEVRWRNWIDAKSWI